MILVHKGGMGTTDTDERVSLLASPRVDGPSRCCTDEPDRSHADRPSSRRRRLWELEAQAHCPVIGVCLPIATLRKLFDRHGTRHVSDDDYELHCDAMDACKRRTALADALQREFDRRYALALQQSAHCKTSDQLSAWWDGASRGADLAGAVWATVTHGRCTPALQHRLLGEVHMHQHQVGAAHRVDHARFDATVAELADARRAVIALQDRLQRQATDHMRERNDDQAQLMQARAELLKRDMTIATLREPIAAQPAREATVDPASAANRSAQQRARIGDLEQALAEACAQIRKLSANASRELAGADGSNDGAPVGPGAPTTAGARALDDRAVLCVGGRPASVPLYRRIVEKTGGRFMHHDGGDEQNVARLDATLAAADLVICQTGCISHDAYWRVKDHCKRTGKPCVFVENPGSASLKRALAEVALPG
jgi:hypothetical protein